jgi:hypothetical protein
MQPTARPPELFDRDLLLQRRLRASRAPVDFLRLEVADQLKERLEEVNRPFKSPVIVGPVDAKFAEASGLGGARIVPDEPVLPLERSAHDLVVHAFSLHSDNDPVGQLVQSRLALVPDGLFIGILFAGQTLHELRASLAQAETEVTSGLSPRVAPMADIRDLGGLLQRAGFALPVADTATLKVTYETPLHLMRDLRGMGETNVMRDRRKVAMRRNLLSRASEIYREAFAVEVGQIVATFEVAFLTGWAPSASQPQPLRPGSARMRLAEALGTDETELNEDENG